MAYAVEGGKSKKIAIRFCDEVWLSKALTELVELASHSIDIKSSPV